MHLNLDATSFIFYNNGNYKTQFENYLSCEQTEKLKIAGLLTLIPIIAAVSYYAIDISTVKEEDTVAIKYPHAQKWYNAMDTKYPQAHLSQKEFRQAGTTEGASFYNIYFLSNSLRLINSLYQKISDNETLTKEEQISLKQYEFILLFQAGYIEENCSIKSQLTHIASFIGTEAIQIPILGLLHSQNNIDSFYNLTREVQLFKSNYNMYAIVDIALYIAVCMPYITKCYNSIGYEFACAQCDNDCLEAALLSFQDNQLATTQLQMVQNEIQRRQTK